MQYQSHAARPLADKVKLRLQRASQALQTVNPSESLGQLLSKTFPYPEGDPRYEQNALTPMAPPFEPSFSETQPHNLRFTIEPLPPEASGSDRRDEATREMRRLIRYIAGRSALYWFDQASESYRGFGAQAPLDYGAFFGSSHDRNGLYSSKVYYETPSGRAAIEGLPAGLFRIVSSVLTAIPGLVPLFTTITAQRDMGGQRLTFACTEPVRLADLRPALDTLGLGHQLAGIMQTLGLVLGGRFELPAHSALVAFGEGPNGPDFEIYALLSEIPDVPPSFLSLLTMGMAERPRGLRALQEWMGAFTPENEYWPGRFTIISLRTDRIHPPRVSLYLRPIEFEMQQQQSTAA